MTNLILITVILAIVAAAVAKIISEKRKGTKCIGCPYSKSCCSRSCSCSDTPVTAER